MTNFLRLSLAAPPPRSGSFSPSTGKVSNLPWYILSLVWKSSPHCGSLPPPCRISATLSWNIPRRFMNMMLSHLKVWTPLYREVFCLLSDDATMTLFYSSTTGRDGICHLEQRGGGWGGGGELGSVSHFSLRDKLNYQNNKCEKSMGYIPVSLWLLFISLLFENLLMTSWELQQNLLSAPVASPDILIREGTYKFRQKRGYRYQLSCYFVKLIFIRGNVSPPPPPFFPRSDATGQPCHQKLPTTIRNDVPKMDISLFQLGKLMILEGAENYCR